MEDNNIFKETIGSGPLFPIELRTNELGNTGWYPVQGDTRLIDNNLESIFLHQIGTKFREEDFGTRLLECIEEPNSQAQAFMVNRFMTEAFKNWESRIEYKETIIQREGSSINLIFSYSISGSNTSKTGILTYNVNNNTLNI